MLNSTTSSIDALTSLLAMLPASQRPAILQEAIRDLPEADALAILHTWAFWARPEQLPPPGTWRVWLYLAGRGAGKTRSGAQWVHAKAAAEPYGILVAPTAADARDVMVEGESGILATAPPWARPDYEPSKRRLTWPNGAVATLFSAEQPDRLRGPQSMWAWCDEVFAWRYGVETWDMLSMGNRLGQHPQIMVTSTPRPGALIRQILGDPETAISRGSTYANAANLPAAFLKTLRRKYEGTRLGRQELQAEILEDTPGALWTIGGIDSGRVAVAPELTTIYVGVDPAASSGEDAAEHGIVVAGKGRDGHLYVLGDHSVSGPPETWAAAVARAYHHHQANLIIAEANNGGEMVAATIRAAGAGLPVQLVHASRGKHTRAEPISMLYAQGRAHHVGAFPKLEDQMTTWVPGMASPDRMDALVWAATKLTAASQGLF